MSWILSKWITGNWIQSVFTCASPYSTQDRVATSSKVPTTEPPLVVTDMVKPLACWEGEDGGREMRVAHFLLTGSWFYCGCSHTICLEHFILSTNEWQYLSYMKTCKSVCILKESIYMYRVKWKLPVTVRCMWELLTGWLGWGWWDHHTTMKQKLSCCAPPSPPPRKTHLKVK